LLFEAVYHIALDNARESHRGAAAIGTTGNGIGPAYEDKVARRGLRVGDLLDETLFSEKLKQVMEYHNFTLKNYYNQEVVDYQKTLDEAIKQASTVKPMIFDIAEEIHTRMSKDENILFEGAQGALLDIDQGTYPFVTSSNTTSGGAVTGSGIGVRDIDYVLGIVKAYTTRVGGGPFPTELNYDVTTDEGDLVGRELCSRGHEFGATTGRQRRCGWLDLVAVRYALRVSGIKHLAVTKADVLSGMEELKEAGRINQIGLTHYSSDALPEMATIMKTGRIDCIQISYNVMEREVETTILGVSWYQHWLLCAHITFSTKG